MAPRARTTLQRAAKTRRGASTSVVSSGPLKEKATLERAKREVATKDQGIKAWPTSKERKRTEPTEFQQRVYDLISTIPEGKVSTYGEVARELSSSARAVGNALRNNPFAPRVPCHRVVASTRTLGGFSGQKGHGAPNLIKKQSMLEEEGVIFEKAKSIDHERVVDKSSIYFFPSLSSATKATFK